MYLFNVRRKHVAGGTIAKRSIATATISGVNNSYTYTGEAIAPTPTVRLGDDLLAANEDYTVDYSNNTAIGMATVTITGKGNYYGTAVKEFYIVADAGAWMFDITKTNTTPTATAECAANASGTKIAVFSGGVIVAPVANAFKKYTFADGADLSDGLESGDSSPTVNNMYGGSVSPDGIHFCAMGSQFNFAAASAAYAISGLTFQQKSNVDTSSCRRFVLSGDGLKLYFIGMWDYGTQGKVYQSNLATAFDFSTLSSAHDATIDFGYATNKKYQDFSFAPNGQKMLWYNDGTVYLFALSTAWDISSASLVGSKAFTLSNAANAAIGVGTGGRKLYILDNGTLKEYALTA